MHFKNEYCFCFLFKTENPSLSRLVNIHICLFIEYVKEIFQVYFSSSKDELGEAARKLRSMTPAPMNTMLEKQPWEESQENQNGCNWWPPNQHTR